jgi:hypothetical protein
MQDWSQFLRQMPNVPPLRPGDAVRINGGVYKGHMAVVNRVHSVMVSVTIDGVGKRRINQTSCGVQTRDPKETKRASAQMYQSRSGPTSSSPPVATKSDVTAAGDDDPGLGDKNPHEHSGATGVMPISLLVELLDALVVQRRASDSVPYAEWVGIRERVNSLYAKSDPSTAAARPGMGRSPNECR